MLLIAHRGCSYPGFNQNTLRAFRKVMDQGVRAVEFDVQRSADGALPVVHNLDLKQVSTGEGSVSRCSADYLRGLFAGDPARGEDGIPFLEEVLTLFASRPEQNRPVMHLELKGDGTGEPAGRMLRERFDRGALRPADLLISSFNWEELRAIRRVCPEVDTALLDGALRRRNLLARLPEGEPYFSDFFAYGEEDYMLPRHPGMEENRRLAASLCPDEGIRRGLLEAVEDALEGRFYTDALLEEAEAMQARSVNLWFRSVRPEFIRRAHRAGLAVLVYTVNREEDLKTAARMGVDGIFTDFYDRARSLLNP